MEKTVWPEAKRYQKSLEGFNANNHGCVARGIRCGKIIQQP